RLTAEPLPPQPCAMRGLWRASLGMLAAAAMLAPPAPAQPSEPIAPPPHVSPWPNLGTGQNDRQLQASLTLGPELQRGQSAREMLAERRRLDAALAALQPQRRGMVD